MLAHGIRSVDLARNPFNGTLPLWNTRCAQYVLIPGTFFIVAANPNAPRWPSGNAGSFNHVLAELLAPSIALRVT